MNETCKHIKLIVADLDGTILHDDKSIDEDMNQCIHALNEIGIQFTLASGRNVHIMKNILQELAVTLPYITNNGANMYEHDQCIYERDMESDALLSAFQILEKDALPFIAYTSDAVYTKDASCEELQEFLQRLKGKTKIINGFDATMGVPDSIFKVVIIPQDSKRMQEAYTLINASCQNLQCVRSEDDIFTMTHIDATKGKTLLELLRKERIDPQDVMVFGDNFNDISMFETAGISIAMGNAHSEVKELADYITDTNNQNGVSSFIRKHIL